METRANPRGFEHGWCRLVVICDFDFVGIFSLPTETNSILIVDADTMLTLPITAESLQTISGWDGEIAKVANPIQKIESSLRNRPQRARTDLPCRTRIDSIENVVDTWALK